MEMTKIEKQRIWNRKNPEKRKEYSKRWKLKNKKRISETFKAWRRNNPEKDMARYLKPKARFIWSKNAAKRRGLVWELTFEQFDYLLTQPCHYAITHIKSTRGCGLDRIDNNIGYIFTNVLPCCKNCNVDRSNIYTVDEWQVMVNAVEDYRKIKKETK